MKYLAIAAGLVVLIVGATGCTSARLTQPEARSLAARLANEAYAKKKIIGIDGKPTKPVKLRATSWRVAKFEKGRWHLKCDPPAGPQASVSFKADGSEPKVKVSYAFE